MLAAQSLAGSQAKHLYGDRQLEELDPSRQHKLCIHIGLGEGA